MAREIEAPFTTGEPVQIRGDRWTIQSVTRYADCDAIATTGCGAGNAGTHRTFLLPFDRVRRCTPVARARVTRRRRWARLVAHNLLLTHPFGGLRTAALAKIELLPYQLEPALAMLRHARLRILIADEVGLGKTVQAGILLNELAHEAVGFRALILSPAGLREQWQRELASKFSLEVIIAGAEWLSETARELPPDVNPWGLPGIYVASLDLVKRPEVLRALEDVRWDLAVVDEVHNAGVGTARLAAAHAIGSRARRVLLLTATPPDADPEAFEAITSIGRTPLDAPVSLFRRSRAETGTCAARKTILLPVRLTPDEQLMHRLLERYTDLVWTEAARRHDGAARFAAILLRKRALSSAASLLRSVSRRLSILGTAPAAPERQLVLPLAEEDQLADDTPDGALAASGLADVARERALLGEIATAAERASARESKMHWLGRLLRRIAEPAIVFTEYRDTLVQIAEFLGPAQPSLLLHGDLSPRDRSAVQRAFNGSGGLLLATDAASEGLNLHERCRLVVHFELPWTPMRLEQRTGRVDRLGQQRAVHEVLVVAHDTAERLVLAPLLRRSRLAASRTGRASSLDELRVAEALMEGAKLEDVEPARLVNAGELHLAQEAETEARRLAIHRRLARLPADMPARPGEVAVSVDRGGFRPELLVLVALSLKNASGRTLHAEALPLAVRESSSWPARSVPQVSTWADSYLQANATRILSEARSLASTRLELAATQARDLFAALLQRERAITAGLGSTARTLVQAGLFDRRALDRASAAHERAALLIEETEIRLLSLDCADLQIEARVVAIASLR